MYTILLGKRLFLNQIASIEQIRNIRISGKGKKKARKNPRFFYMIELISKNYTLIKVDLFDIY